MNNPAVVDALLGRGQQAQHMLYGSPAPLRLAPTTEEPEEYADNELVEEEPRAQLPPHDPLTGEVLNGHAVEEEAEPKTFGPRPEKDMRFPTGIHENEMLSDVARTPDGVVYLRKAFAKSVKWPLAKAWIEHCQGPDDMSDIIYDPDKDVHYE